MAQEHASPRHNVLGDPDFVVENLRLLGAMLQPGACLDDEEKSQLGLWLIELAGTVKLALDLRKPPSA